METQETGTGRGWWRRFGPAAAVAAAAALHVALVLRRYPPALLWRGEIPFHGDIYRYFATAQAAARCGGLYGYDPFFMAGYPVGLWNSIGKKGFEMAHLLLPGLPFPALFYLALVVVPIVAPVVLWIGLRARWPTARGRLGLLLLILAYWHLDTHTAYFWGFGNVFFPGTACLVPLMALAFWNLLEGRRRWLSAAALGLMAGAAAYTHPVVLVAAAVASAAAAAFRPRALAAGRTWLALTLAAGVFVLLTAAWLTPLWQNRHDCVPSPHPFLQGSWKHFFMDFFSDRGYRHRFDRTFLLHAAVALGGAGTVLAWRARRWLAALGSAGFGCLALAYAGSHVPYLTFLQPYRFLIPATMLLLAPLAAGGEWMLAAWSRGGAAARRLAAVAALLLLPPAAGYVFDLLWTRPVGGLSDGYRAALQALDALPADGRLLCDDMNLGHLIPFYRQRAVIGGLSTQAFLKHRFAGMDNNGACFGRAPEDWTAADLRIYLDAYGIAGAVLQRGEWLALAARCAELFEPAGSAAGFRFYRVRNAQPSLALEGEADVRADYGRIDVRRARSRVLVLKLHYAPWLRADRGVRLDPQPVLDDPVPFLRATLPAGVEAFTIRGP